MDEHDAIARMKEGDMAGLQALVAAHQVRAVRTAYLIVRDRPLAEDIVQQAFIRAYERIYQLQAGRPFGPWFLRSVANDALKALERRRRTLSIEEGQGPGRAAWGDLLTDPGLSPEVLVESAERSEAIWQAIGRLPAEQQAAIVLRYYAGLSDAEIADKMEAPAPTIRWRLHAARERLRAQLSAWREHGAGKGRPASPPRGE